MKRAAYKPWPIWWPPKVRAVVDDTPARRAEQAAIDAAVQAGRVTRIKPGEAMGAARNFGPNRHRSSVVGDG